MNHTDRNTFRVCSLLKILHTICQIQTKHNKNMKIIGLNTSSVLFNDKIHLPKVESGRFDDQAKKKKQNKKKYNIDCDFYFKFEVFFIHSNFFGKQMICIKL